MPDSHDNFPLNPSLGDRHGKWVYSAKERWELAPVELSIRIPHIGPTAPADPYNGVQWYDTEYNVLSFWDEPSSTWVEVTGANGFGVNDVVTRFEPPADSSAPFTCSLLAAVDETVLFSPGSGFTGSVTALLPDVVSLRVGQVKTFFTTREVSQFGFNGSEQGVQWFGNEAIGWTLPANSPVACKCVGISATHSTWLRLA